MKNMHFLLLIGLCIFVEAQHEQKNVIHEQTVLVYRRYYFIERLDRTIKLLSKMYNEVNSMQEMLAGRNINFDCILPSSSCHLFAHKQVLRSAKRIMQTRSLKPLFMVWDSFSSYKSLHDDLLVEDFSKEIFVITRNTIDYVCRSNNENKYIKKYKTDQLCNSLTLQERIETISTMTDLLESVFSGSNYDVNKQRIADMYDLKMRIHTDEIAFRFYFLHRLESAMNYLLSLPDHEHLLAKQNHLPDFAVGYWPKGEGKTLQQLWDDIHQYKCIDDEIFMRNFAVQVLFLLDMQKQHLKSRKELSHNEVLAIHQHIEQLPLEEILNAIDVIVGQVSMVSEHYHKSGLSFSQWIRQYWWVPPLVFSSIIFKFVSYYYKNISKDAA